MPSLKEVSNMPQFPKDAFKGKKVLVTGHTGFKGTWLSLWLNKLGAHVIGYSLAPSDLFSLVGLENRITHAQGDVRDLAQLSEIVQTTNPDAVFHFAAQSIVLNSYKSPQETFSTNALGTVNVLEACRRSPSIRAIVIATTDKCYENRSWVWGYRENDRLGGKDPYSASKAMAELAASSYRESFLKGNISVATVRCGNVIGGGDFSPHRLLPDCFRALINQQSISVRNPKSIRPWLHVLDALYGYLKIAGELLTTGEIFSGSWNFGPFEKNAVTVQEMVEYAIETWGSGNWTDNSCKNAPEEMETLKLNWEKAAKELSWSPRYCWKEAIEKTASWFKAYDTQSNMFETCMQQIEKYENDTSPARGRFSHQS